MDYKRFFLHLFYINCIFGITNLSKNNNSHKKITNKKVVGHQSIKNLEAIEASSDNHQDIENLFYNIYYETSNDIVVSIKFYNGSIESLELLKKVRILIKD
jgi:hypothetical protein